MNKTQIPFEVKAEDQTLPGSENLSYLENYSFGDSSAGDWQTKKKEHKFYLEVFEKNQYAKCRVVLGVEWVQKEYQNIDQYNSIEVKKEQKGNEDGKSIETKNAVPQDYDINARYSVMQDFGDWGEVVLFGDRQTQRHQP